MVKRNTLYTSAITAILAVAVIVISVWLGHPLMGLRSVTYLPSVEVLDTKQNGAHVQITVQNNDTNALTGEAGYRLVNQKNITVYASTPAPFGPLLPEATVQLTVALPQNPPPDVTIQGWASEQIAYINDPQPEGFSVREPFSQGITIESAALTADADGNQRLDVHFRLTNVDSEAAHYRYVVELTRVENQNGKVVPQASGIFSPFTEISMSALETQNIDSETIGLSLEKDTYQVSVWLQIQDATGAFVQRDQASYSQDLTVS